MDTGEALELVHAIAVRLKESLTNQELEALDVVEDFIVNNFGED